MQNHRLVRQRATFQVQQCRGRTQELERQQTQFLLAVGCWLLAVHSSLDTLKVKIARRLEVKLRLAVPENYHNLASFAKISTPVPLLHSQCRGAASSLVAARISNRIVAETRTVGFPKPRNGRQKQGNLSWSSPGFVSNPEAIG